MNLLILDNCGLEVQVATRDLTITDTSRWFGRPDNQPTGACILFCLPYSGGGASVFHSWRHARPAGIEIAALHLPGREDRISEPLSLSPDAIAAAITARADRPYALYGHSLGARLGFEVLRAIRRRGGPPPVRLYAAAARPPDVVDPLARSVELPEEDFLSALIDRIQTPAEIRDIPELRSLLLPVLRADFEWINSYEYRHEPPLPVPLVCLAGSADTEAGPLVMLGWSRHTCAGYRLHTLPGGHFFLRTAADQLIDLVSADLLAVVRAARSPLTQPPAIPPPAISPPAADEVHLLLAALDDLPGACGAWAELSSHEALMAARIRDPRQRHRYVGQCVVFRRMARRYGIDAGPGGLPTGGRGLPGDADRAALRFDLSSSGGLILIGVTAGPGIGVGIERIEPAGGGGAGTTAKPTEPAGRGGAGTATIHDEPARGCDADRLAALRIRAAREALLAAAGRGCAADRAGPGRHDPDAGDPWQPGAAGLPPGLDRWRVTHLPLDGAVAALAVAADEWRLRFETMTEVTG